MKIADPMTKEQRAAQMATAAVGYDRYSRPKLNPDTGEFEWENTPNGGRRIVLETKYAATIGEFIVSNGQEPFRFDTTEDAIAYAEQLRKQQYEIAKAAGLLQ